MTSTPTTRSLVRIVRVAITAGLLTFLIRRAGGQALVHELAKVSPLWLLPASVANVALIAVAIARWFVLITPKPDGLTPWALARVFVTSCFYGAVGPGTFGVDAMRVMLLSRLRTGRTAAAVSVTVDRAMGFAATAALALPAITAAGILTRAALLPPFARFGELKSKAVAAIGALAREPWRIAVALPLSVLAISLWGVTGWCTLAALGHTVPLLTLVSFVACAELASAVPISLQGVGVRELVFAAFLAPHGISPADATLLGLLMYAQSLGMMAAGTLLLRAIAEPSLEPSPFHRA